MPRFSFLALCLLLLAEAHAGYIEDFLHDVAQGRSACSCKEAVAPCQLRTNTILMLARGQNHENIPCAPRIGTGDICHKNSFFCPPPASLAATSRAPVTPAETTSAESKLDVVTTPVATTTTTEKKTSTTSAPAEKTTTTATTTTTTTTTASAAIQTLPSTATTANAATASAATTVTAAAAKAQEAESTEAVLPGWADTARVAGPTSASSSTAFGPGLAIGLGGGMACLVVLSIAAAVFRKRQQKRKRCQLHEDSPEEPEKSEGPPLPPRVLPDDNGAYVTPIPYVDYEEPPEVLEAPRKAWNKGYAHREEPAANVHDVTAIVNDAVYECVEEMTAAPKKASNRVQDISREQTPLYDMAAEAPEPDARPVTEVIQVHPLYTLADRNVYDKVDENK